jgi:hypothetical protein
MATSTPYDCHAPSKYLSNYSDLKGEG